MLRMLWTERRITTNHSFCERPGTVRVTGPQPPRIRPCCLSVAWPGWPVWVPGSELSVILPFIPLGQSNHRQEPQAGATTLKVNIPLFSALSNTCCPSVQRQLGLGSLQRAVLRWGGGSTLGGAGLAGGGSGSLPTGGASAHPLPRPFQPTSSSGLASLAWW